MLFKVLFQEGTAHGDTRLAQGSINGARKVKKPFPRVLDFSSRVAKGPGIFFGVGEQQEQP